MYNSCRNRHCPNCQALASAKWLAGREKTILPTHYFHVVFTLPQELRALVKANDRALYGLLLKTSAHTLLTLGADEKWLGGQMGLTAVLHTWTRDLRYHPHAHLIVTGGGLDKAQKRWVETKQDFLFPVKVIGSLFRGKFLAGLNELYQRGDLRLPDDWQAPGAFYEYTSRLAKKSWVVYCKTPFAGARQVYAYISRYTHRVAISNYRILSFKDGLVTFKTKGTKTVSLPTHVFISRFLQHVLPYRFTRLRHYGLLAPINVKTRLPLALSLLGGAPKPNEQASDQSSAEPTTSVSLEFHDDWRSLASSLLEHDLRRCPACGKHALLALPLPAITPTSAPRGPPIGEVA